MHDTKVYMAKVWVNKWSLENEPSDARGYAKHLLEDTVNKSLNGEKLIPIKVEWGEHVDLQQDAVAMTLEVTLWSP